MAQPEIFAISAAGMTLERTRVEIAALNLANAHTTAAPGQSAYLPLRVVARPNAATSFPALMAPAFSVEPTDVVPRQVHEPGHPLADARGFVTYPGVDTTAEMITMLGATRAYEANLAAMNTARTLALKSLDIGGTS